MRRLTLWGTTALGLEGKEGSATGAEIKQQFYARSKELHPDATGNEGDSESFNRLVEAFTVLKDPKRRREYDARSAY